MIKKTFHIKNKEDAFSIFGKQDEFLSMIEEEFPVTLTARGLDVNIKGEKKDVDKVMSLFCGMQEALDAGKVLDEFAVSSAITAMKNNTKSQLAFSDGISVPSKRKFVWPRTEGQIKYVEAIKSHDIVFAIGPAGTGKTYLAVAMAVHALQNSEVSRIVLVRPAVEAGEKLGFLPGSFQEKVDPYLRPLYDALYDMMEIEKFQNLSSRGVIEIAPLAYMRGRTLNDSFIILDEAQNTTIEQMKMFLTRLGFDSKAVITGDITQVDLPSGKMSGLIHVQEVLKHIKGIHFSYFDEKDVVRHELVQQIIRAYASNEGSRNKNNTR